MGPDEKASSINQVTRILSAFEQSDLHAAEQLLPLVYDELQQLAATALIDEAYLRLVGFNTSTAVGTSSRLLPRPCAVSWSITSGTGNG